MKSCCHAGGRLCAFYARATQARMRDRRVPDFWSQYNMQTLCVCLVLCSVYVLCAVRFVMCVCNGMRRGVL